MKTITHICLLYLIAATAVAVPLDLSKLTKNHRPRTMEKNWLIDGQEAKKLFDKGEALLIDIREEKEPAIPGAIRIPTYTLKRNKAFQKKKLILINEGYGYKEAMSLCRKSGLPWIKCLEGGIHSWQKTGGSLLKRIPPAKLFSDRNFEEIKILDIGKDQKELFPLAISLPKKSPAKQITAVAKDLAERKDTAYVVIACSKQLEQKISAQRVKTQKPVFFIKGGRSAYRKWLFTQAKVLRQYKIREQIQGCPTCR